MKNRLSVSLILLAITVFGMSAASKVTATSILDKVLAKIESVPSMTVNMTLSANSSNTAGTLTFAGEKFRFDSGEMSVFYDGATQWTLDKGAGEVSLTNPTAEEIIETNPLAFMRNYQKRYKVSLKSSSSTTYVVHMDAKTKSTYVRSADVTVNASTMMPTSVTAILSTGQHLRISIASMTTGNTLPISSFRFDTKKIPISKSLTLDNLPKPTHNRHGHIR